MSTSSNGSPLTLPEPDARSPAPERENSRPGTSSLDLGSATTLAEPAGLPPERPRALPPPGLFDLPIVDFDRYDIEGVHAKGGLGRILGAWDRRLDRFLALKELLVSEPRAEVRFIREALVTARLQHPSIVPVHDAGRRPDGRVFYTMKMISGASLKEAIAEARHLDQRLALLPNLIAVADAMAYAHGMGIIHRDLKPSNILIGPFGETVVIDWGLAKDLRLSEEDLEIDPAPYELVGTDMTVLGTVLGTPPYMPPEQARGERVDERADVYALGAVLYHLLAGTPPYEPYEGENAEQLLAQIRSGPPPPLEARPSGVPADLVTIVRKAMSRDAQDRYPTARELAEDLRRFQTGQLVAARAYSRWTLAARWLRRYRLVVTSVALVALGGLAAVQRVVRERNTAARALLVAEEQQRRAEVRGNRLILAQAHGWLERDPTEALAWLKSHPLPPSELVETRNLVLDAFSRGVARHVLRREERYSMAGAFSADGRRFAAPHAGRQLRLWDLDTGQPLHSLPYHGEIQLLALSPDAQTVAFATSGQSDVRLWSVATGAVRELTALEPLAALRFASDGGWLLGAGADRRIHLWHLPDGERVDLLCKDDVRRRVALSPDGRHVACVDPAHGLVTWEVATRRQRALGRVGDDLELLVFSPDGRYLAAGHRDGALERWAVDGGDHRRWRGHGQAVGAIAFSPDGQQLVSAGLDETVRLWQLDSGRGEILGQHGGRIYTVAFSPDGRQIASGGADTGVQLWNRETGAHRVLRGHRADVTDLRFSPDGRRLASASRDRSTRIWDVDTGVGQVWRVHQRGIGEVAISPQGRWVVSAGDDGLIGLWELPHAEFHRLEGHGAAVDALAFSPDGRALASGSEDRTVRLWDLASQRERWLGHHGDSLWELAFAPGGRTLASASSDGLIKLWNTEDGSAEVLRGHQGNVRAIAFSSDGQLLASGGSDASIRIWRLGPIGQRGVPDAPERLLHGPGKTVTQVAFAPSGREVAATAWDGTVWLWTLAGGEARLLGRHPEGWTALAFAPDGTALASVGIDGAVRLWEFARPSSRTLLGHDGGLNAISFSPDGKTLATGGWDGTVRLWDRDSGTYRCILRHETTVRDVVFSPDGASLVSAGEDRTVRLWQLARLPKVPRTLAALATWMAELTSTTINGDDQVATP